MSKAKAIEGKALTPREIDILEAATRGLGSRDIAQTLGLTIGTVHTYKKRLYKKLGVSSMLAAVQLWSKKISKLPLDPALEVAANDIYKYAETSTKDVIGRESLSLVISRAADLAATATKTKRYGVN